MNKKKDPLIDELRDAGQAYIDSFKGDWKSIIADLERRSKEEGRRIVSYLPRRVESRSRPTKKAK